MRLDIKPLEYDFSVCKLSDLSMVRFHDELFFVAKTDEEMSLVCLTSSVPENTTDISDGWRGFRICGELDFSLIGILSRISGVLADGGIGIFAVSTYNTDYVFVKKENFNNALALLSDAGHRIV